MGAAKRRPTGECAGWAQRRKFGPVAADGRTSLLSAALEALGIDNLVLGIHDPAFPALPFEDPGRGTPYSRGAASLFELARSLGFNGVQLGPQGETSEHNPSPYDGSAFSRDPLEVSLGWLLEHGLLSSDALASIATARPSGEPTRVAHAHAYRALRRALVEAFESFRRSGGRLQAEAQALRSRESEWLEPDALYSVLAAKHGSSDFREWRAGDADPWSSWEGAKRLAELRRRSGEEIDRHAFVQLLLQEQHAELRERCRVLGLKLYGDLQIGLSPRDVWSRQRLFLSDFVMGAPPSRTNPEGQPWGYPVLDPDQYSGPVLRFVERRAGKLFDEFDGLRIDHPHGLVCPWVYRRGIADPLRAVQQGARLFESPDLADHPSLSRYSLVRPEQLNRSVPRHADDWVKWLDEEQVTRYAVVLGAMVSAAAARGRPASALVCEVLSTLPLPLGKVLERYRLGRFRITQKANLDDPADVYRSENAAPEDWIMTGNHDTSPIWAVAEDWERKGQARRQARYLSERLIPDEGQRRRWEEAFAADPALLAQGKLAELFASRARNVFVYFTDLFGLKEPYNVPGTISERNWSLRLPADFAHRYQDSVAAGRALDLPWALAMAIRAKGGLRELAARLASLTPARPPPG